MADKKLNELGTTESFDNAYVELSQNQYRISKANLGRQLTNEVHANFSVTSSNPDFIFGTKYDGTKIRISRSDLAKAIINDGVGLNGAYPGNRAIFDGCFIMFHGQEDGWPRAVPYAGWRGLQENGEEADGVLIIEGGHSLVIAPHEKSCYWSSKTGLGSQDTVDYSSATRILLLNEWDGEERTIKICTIKSSPFYEESNNASTKNTYAPGYCHNYTPHVAENPGLTAGKYWLPCVAELMMIYTHKYRINAGLALINGANQLSETYYWSSTEHSATYAWNLSLNNGYLDWYGKVSGSYKVRPVSAFIHDTY